MGSKKPTFEKAMKQLEQIVDELESGELPLEKALQKFEEGISLSKFCSEKLEETERRISQLTADKDGAPLETPFETDSGTDAPV
jgi:exodeoxyribonuclease VII small subunit